MALPINQQLRVILSGNPACIGQFSGKRAIRNGQPLQQEALVRREPASIQEYRPPTPRIARADQRGEPSQNPRGFKLKLGYTHISYFPVDVRHLFPYTL